MALNSLTPIAWRLADAESALAHAEAAWARAIREGRSAATIADLGVGVNWALDTLDEVRAEAGLA